MRTLASAGRQTGVSMIEVLVATVILAFGLISVALLQTSALQNNYLSNQYTVASAVAQSLSEAMRANRAGVLANNYNIAAGPPPPAPTVNCATNSCTAAERARWDLAAAYASISTTTYGNIPSGPSALLPSGGIQIGCADAVCAERSLRVISVFWDANRNASTDYSCAAAEQPCFRLVHVP